MKKCFLFLLIIAGLSVQANPGYVPGYVGKRFSAGANVSTFFMFEDFNSVSDMMASTRFSYKTEVVTNYAIGRKVSAGFSFYFARQRYLAGRNEYRSSNSYEDVRLEDKYMHCRLMMFEFNLKFFGRNFIAPIGRYHQLGVALVKYNAVAPGDSLELFNRDRDVVDVVMIKKDPLSCFKLSYHMGYATPVFKNCIFNVAFGVNFFRGGDSAKIKRDFTESTYVAGVLNKHLRRHNFFELKIGLQFLAF